MRTTDKICGTLMYFLCALCGLYCFLDSLIQFADTDSKIMFQQVFIVLRPDTC